MFIVVLGGTDCTSTVQPCHQQGHVPPAHIPGQSTLDITSQEHFPNTTRLAKLLQKQTPGLDIVGWTAKPWPGKLTPTFQDLNKNCLHMVSSAQHLVGWIFIGKIGSFTKSQIPYGVCELIWGFFGIMKAICQGRFLVCFPFIHVQRWEG